MHTLRVDPVRERSIHEDDDDPLLVSGVIVLSKPSWSHRNLLVFEFPICDKKLGGILSKFGKRREIEVIVDNELLSAITFHRILGKRRAVGNPRLDRLFTPIGLPSVRISIHDIDVLSLISFRFRNGGLAVWEENREGGRGVQDSGVGLPSFPISLSPLITFRMFRHEHGTRANGKSLFTYIFNYAIPTILANTRFQVRVKA